MKRRWKIAFGVAAANDLLDLTPIGSSPFPGVLINLVSNVVLWPVLKTRRSLLTLLDYVPFVSVLPVYTLTVLYSYIQREETGKTSIEIN